MSETLSTGGAGLHNSICRGYHLGASLSSEQLDAIQSGTFDGLWIGDYWIIDNVTYRIADFDYYYRTGDAGYECTNHHVVIVPDTVLYDAVMNSSDTTKGGYTGSAMYKSGLNSAKTKITNAFGTSHILSHRDYLSNAVTGGKVSGGAWYDSAIELMTEQMVYGCKVFAPTSNGTDIPDIRTVSCKQLNLFRYRHDLISNRHRYWLRDVVSGAAFAYVTNSGIACSNYASNSSIGVRPAFPIY